jgi:putative ABC transport system permease protein
MLMRLFRRAVYLLRRDREARELAEEMEFHRSLLARGSEADGGGPGPAFGNVTLAREDAREVWIGRLPEQAWRDAVYGARGLRREPTFTLTALLTLALGSATTITVFSVVDAEIWKPLPLPEAHRLVAVEASAPGTRQSSEQVSVADFMDWRAQSRLADYIARLPTSRRELRQDTAESVTTRPVSADFFRILRQEPRLGRSFSAEDERGPRTAIVSDAGWKRLFNADPTVVGRTVSIDEESYAIVGIAGPRLEFMTEPDFFVVFDPTAAELRDRSVRVLDVYARLRPGATLEQAQAELRAIAGRIALEVPDNVGHGVELFDLQRHETGFNWRPLFFFLGAAALVLVLSCLNVANLLLARAFRRQREFAIRGALGGGRRALVRQLIVEGLLLAVPGAAAGALVSIWVLALFTSQIPPGFLGRGTQIQPDLRVAMFVFAVAGGTTLLLALVPLVFARRVELNLMLGGSRTAGYSSRQRRMRTALLVGQVTMTLVLLAGAGLFLRSFARLTEVSLGFEPDNRVALRITPSGARYAGDPAVLGFSQRLLEQARGAAGVRDAAVGSSSPLGEQGGPAVEVVVPERPLAVTAEKSTALIATVSPGYFRTLGIARLAGREFTEEDVTGAPRVAIVNELMARRLFPGESALGKRLQVMPLARTGWTNLSGTVVIVGVMANVRNFGLNEVEFSNLYVPFAQAPAPAVELIVSATIPAGQITDTLRTAVRSVDPALAITRMTTLPDRVDGAFRGARFNLQLIGFFALVATLLAGVGVYGAMACAVEERRREFGVRLALGALPRMILGSSLRESARIGLAGGVLGAAITLVLARILGNALYLVPGKHGGLLYGVTTTDPIALGGSFVTLIAIATLSGLVPARQATRIDPLVALRDD